MEIADQLKDPHNVAKILLYLYGYQTTEEQAASQTHESNGVGFNMLDAEILSSFAQQAIKGYTLSEKQLGIARLRLPKYKGQLESGAWQNIVLPHKDVVAINLQRGLKQEIYADKNSATCAGTLELEKGAGGVMGLAFRPNVFPSKQIKTIGFTFWQNGLWHQSHPSVNQTAVNDVLRMFGNTVIVAPEVTEALRPTEVSMPKMIIEDTALRQYQKETIAFQLTHPHALIALAPRLGKTVTTIKSVLAADCKKVLVVAPLSLLLDWRIKIKRWSGEDAAVVYKKQLLVPNRWTITNYDTVRLNPATFTGEKWDCIIIDESLLIKNRHAKRFDSIKALVIDAKPKYLWLLSGAPVAKMYTDLWSQLHILDTKRFSSFWRFAERYCLVEANQYSNYNLVGDQPDAAERIKEDLSDLFFYRSQEDVTDMPPWQIENRPVAMSVGQDRLYAEMEEAFLTDLGDDNKVIAPNQLAQMTRLIQLASNPLLLGGKDDSPKWDAAIEMLQYEQFPAIMWTNFIETANYMLERLHAKGYKAAKLTGATRPEERQQIVEDFQCGRLDIIIAHPAVGKYGLDLFAAKTVIYLERNYNSDDYYQSLNRVRHIDAKVSPHIVHLISVRANSSANTVDFVIDKVLEGRRAKVRKLTSHEVRNLFFQEKE